MTDKAKAFFDACAEGRHLEVQEALREASDAQTHTLLDQDVPFKPAGYNRELKLKPLHVAAWRGHGEVVKLLVDKGANLHAQNNDGSINDGSTALHLAAWRGHGEVVKLLVDKGANLEAQDNDGFTALLSAAYKGHGEVVKLLVDKGANLEAQDNKGSTALHLAADRGHGEVVKLLVDKGANLDAQRKAGRTALHAASMKGHGDVVKLLVDEGANLHAQDNDGWTALHLAAMKGHGEVVKLLVDKGANLEVHEEHGNTALHWAARQGHREVVKLLVDKGANLEAQTKEGWTALYMAAWRGHREVVKLLVDKGANLEAQNKGGQTALLRAAWDGHAEVVKLLVDKGANLDAQDNEGWTALFLAARYDNVPAAVVLLEAGADLATKNENGETPLHKVLRTRERLEGIVEELIERNNQTGEPSNGKLEAIVYNLVQNSLEDDIAFSYLRKILLYYQANDATSSVKVLRLVAVLVDSSLQSFKFSDTDFSKLGKLVACSLQETLQSNFFYKPLATLALLAGVLGNRAGFRKQVKDDLLSLRSKVIQLAIAALSIPEMDGENVALEALGYSCDDISKGTFLVLHKLSDMGPVQGAAPFAFLMANSVEELIMVPQLQSSIDKIFYKRRNVIIPSEEIYQLSVLSKDQLFQNKGQYITPNTQICLDDSTFQGHREELKLTDKYLGKPLQFLLFEIFMNWKAQDWRMLPTLFFISQFIFHGLYFALTVVVFWHSEMASWCTSTLFMMTIGYAAEEIHQVVSEHSVRHYINDPWNLFDLLFLVSFFTWYATGQDAWLALNMFLVPFRLLHYLRIFETFGIFVAVLLRMMVATARFLIFYAVILFGFAAMMFALYGNQNIEGFGSFPDACRTLFDASLGNYDLYSFDEMDEYPWVGVALLVSFLLLALVMALNLLIAILSEEYSQLAGCAYMEWCFMYAKIAQENVVLESKFPDTSSLKLPPPLSLISFLAQLLVWISFYLQSTAVNKGFDTPIEITSNPVHESAPKSQSAGLQNDEPEQQHQASIANLAAQPSVQVKVLQRIATILQLTAIILVASVDLVVHILTGLLWMLLAIYVQSFKMMLGQADVPDYVLELLSCSFLKPERKTKLLMVTGCFLWFFAGVPFVSVFVFFWCTRSSVQAYAFLMPGKAEPKTTSSKARPNNTKHVLEQVKGAILNCAITDDGNEFAQVLSEVSNVKAEVLGKVATVENQVAKVESQVAKVERQVEAQVGELKAHMGELKAQVEAQGGKLEAMMARLLEAQGLATPTPAMEESVTKEEGDGTGGLAPAGVDETKSSS